MTSVPRQLSLSRRSGIDCPASGNIPENLREKPGALGKYQLLVFGVGDASSIHRIFPYQTRHTLDNSAAILIEEFHLSPIPKAYKFDFPIPGSSQCKPGYSDFV